MVAHHQLLGLPHPIYIEQRLVYSHCELRRDGYFFRLGCFSPEWSSIWLDESGVFRIGMVESLYGGYQGCTELFELCRHHDQRGSAGFSYVGG
jgi:hypothetical protein